MKIIRTAGVTAAPTNHFLGAAGDTSRPYKPLIYINGVIRTAGKTASANQRQPKPPPTHTKRMLTVAVECPWMDGKSPVMLETIS
jgi:hypothetical protein